MTNSENKVQVITNPNLQEGNYSSIMNSQSILDSLPIELATKRQKAFDGLFSSTTENENEYTLYLLDVLEALLMYCGDDHVRLQKIGFLVAGHFTVTTDVLIETDDSISLGKIARMFSRLEIPQEKGVNDPLHIKKEILNLIKKYRKQLLMG